MELIRYEAARQALAECVQVDEVKDMRDKAKAMAAYVLQRDGNSEMAVWVSEIYLRACQRIGQLSRELETAPPGPGPADTSQRREVSPKADALADAGISTSTAHRYEQLAGGKTEQGQRAAEAATEAYLANARADKVPATLEGLKAAVHGALVATLGPLPDRTKVVSFRGKPDALALAVTDLGAGIDMILEVGEPDMERLAGKVHKKLITQQLDSAQRAIARLRVFVAALKRRQSDAA